MSSTIRTISTTFTPTTYSHKKKRNNLKNSLLLIWWGFLFNVSLCFKLNNMELPMLIQRCLTYGVKIYPYQLKRILTQYKLKKVPDEKMSIFNALQTEKYVKALYLCGEEMSRDWDKGHDLLKELGFEETTITEGHRSFVSLTFNSSFEPVS